MSVATSRQRADLTDLIRSRQPRPAGRSPSAAHATLRRMLFERPVPIAYLAGQFPLPSETFVYREVRGLRDRGWHVSAVALHDPVGPAVTGGHDLERDRAVVYGSGTLRTLQGFGLEMVYHPLATLRTLATAAADAASPGEPTPWKARLRLPVQAAAGVGLADRLRRDGTAHVHCHFAHAPTTVGMYAARQLGVPFSFTGHANDLFQRRTLLKRKLERAAFVACISRWHRDFYRAIAPADDAVYPVVRCGVDTGSWTAESHRTPEMVGAGPLRVLTVCRLVEKKGVDLLIGGLAQWRGTDGWTLTVAGDGPDRRSLERLAADLGVSARVKFLGLVDNPQVRELLKEADVFALVCRTDAAGDKDGIPVVLMEAMASGVPVIAGELPAVRELVVPGVTGLLVDPKVPSQLTLALETLANEPGLRASLGVAGRAAVRQEFDLGVNVDRLQALFERTVRRSRGSEPMSDTPPPNEATSAAGRRYALVTPCRDEAKYARRTLESVVNQTVPPAAWVIVDDGSKDQTPAILAEYAAKYPYIKIIRRADRGDRKLGGGVIDAFYTGYDTIDPGDFDYVCKFDLDLDLPPAYFATLMGRMEADPRIGTASGKPFFTAADGTAVEETCGDENSVGMIKFYRTACFGQIGGFVRELMWDGIDCHRCRMLGWIAVSWPDPALRFEHLRPMGTSHRNWWTGRVRHGVGQYFMGTGPAYLLASAAFRLARPPVVLGSAAMLWGYVRSAWQRKPRYGDPAFRSFLSRYQWNCLLRGKAAATEQLNRRQSAAWHPAARA